MSAHDNETHHMVPYKVYVYIWAALVILTGITVGASYMQLGHVAIFTAILIATVKAGLVLMYFMHIRFEKPIFTVMILATLAAYGIFIGLTFTDYFYR
jgi:cytochrome c oxidase subunit 4